MKKKVAAQLTSIAHRILQMKNKEDVHELKAVVSELYEKLSVLEFAYDHLDDAQPTIASAQIEQLLDSDEVIVETAVTPQDKAPAAPAKIEEPSFEELDQSSDQEIEAIFANPDLSELFVPAVDEREEMDLPGSTTINKMVEEFPDEEEQLQTDLFASNDLGEITAGYGEMPQFERKVNDQQEKKTSLNERLKSGIKIGVNDRLGFVKHLFNGSDQDFERVLSQLQTIESKTAAHELIEHLIKPDYNNWQGKESYEERFMQLINARFDA
jgi:hypothetical protein